MVIMLMLGLGNIAKGQVTLTTKKYDKLKEKADKAQNLEKDVKRLNKEVEKLTKANRDIPNKEARIKELEKQVQNLQTQNDQILGKNDEIKKLKAENNKLKDDIAKKDREITLKNNEIAGLKKSNKSIAIKNEEIKKLKKEKTDLQAQIRLLENQNKSIGIKQSQINRLKKDSTNLKEQVTKLQEAKKELEVKEILLKICERKKGDLEKTSRDQAKEIERLKKIEGKFNTIEQDLRITFIKPVDQFTKGLDYDKDRAKRLQGRCLRLASSVPKHKDALNLLAKNLQTFSNFSAEIKKYRLALGKKYGTSPNISPSSIKSVTTAQANDLKAYQGAYDNYCKKNGITYNRVNAARSYIVKYPQRMRTKLTEARNDLDKRYTYLRQEINKSLRNLNYVCKISKSKCN